MGTPFIIDTHLAEEITENQGLGASIKVTVVPVSKMRVYPLPNVSFPATGQDTNAQYHSGKLMGIFSLLTYFTLRNVKLFHQHCMTV